MQFTLLLAFTDLFKAQVQDLFGFHKDACAATDVPLQTMTSMACFLFKFSAVVGATNLFYTAAVGVLTLVIFRFAAGNQKVTQKAASLLHCCSVEWLARCSRLQP